MEFEKCARPVGCKTQSAHIRCVPDVPALSPRVTADTPDSLHYSAWPVFVFVQ
jgi:hypothetical protein